MIGLSLGLGRLRKAGATLDAATTAWVNQVVTNGGTVSAGRQTTVNTLITSLKNNNLWTLLDRLWLLAAENNISARTDLVGLALATVTGSPTFTTNRGYTGTDVASATDYLLTGYIPSTNGVKLTQNAAHISAWSVTNNAAVNGGNLGGVIGLNIFDTFTDGNFYGRVNDNVESGSQGAPGTRAGNWLVNRSGANASQISQNGSLFSSPNAASGALSTFQLAILALNQNGSIAAGTPNQVAMFSLGGDLTSVASGVTNFYNALRTYLTAVGVP